MNVVPIIKQVQEMYLWSETYSYNVANEYTRFLQLRANDNSCVPPDDVQKFWFQHIVNTWSYTTYCKKKFFRYIHCDVLDCCSETEKQLRLQQTILKYKKTFGNFINESVWGSQNNGQIGSPDLRHPMSNLNLKSLPPIKTSHSFHTSILPANNVNKNIIKAKIIYVYNDGNNKYKQYSESNQHEGKVIIHKIEPCQTLDDFRHVVSAKTSHNHYLIHFYPSDFFNGEIEIKNTRDSIKLTTHLISVSYNYPELIAVLISDKKL